MPPTCRREPRGDPKRQGARHDEADRQPAQARAGRQRGAAADDQDEPVGQNDEGVPAEAFEPLKHAADRQHVRTHHQRSTDEVACDAHVPFAAQHRRGDQQCHEAAAGPQQLDPQRVSQQIAGPCPVAGHLANDHLMEPEVHQRLEDRPEHERERELPELDVAEEPPGHYEEDEEKAGAGR